MKKWLLCGLTALALLCLCACGETPPKVTDTTAAEAVTTAPPARNLAGYTLIRAESADAETLAAVSALYAQIKAVDGGGEVGLSDDFVPYGGKPDPAVPEILYGLTNRPESAEALAVLPGYLDFSVGMVGEKLCIAANTPERLADAAAYFVANLTGDGGVLRYTGGQYVGRADYPLGDASLCGGAVGEYTIVYPAGGVREQAAAEQLAVWFGEQTGHLLPVSDDSAAEHEREIVIGKTNRAASLDPAALAEQTYGIKASGSKLALAAATTAGYHAIKERMMMLMSDNKLTENFAEAAQFTANKLDGARVMFIGNSFTYYGYCTSTKNQIMFDDQGYFHQVAAAMGDDVDVTSVTYGGAVLHGSNKEKSLYDILISSHPNHYSSGNELDPFYVQDYVIIQQAGENPSSNEASTRAIMALFPPETKFCFFVHHHNVWRNHSYVLGTARTLRDEGSAIYLPVGHLIYEVWTGKAEVPGATLRYNQDSFCVNQPNDRYHPNYLTGYLTALTVYYAITGKSIVDCPHGFVKTSLEYYKDGATSNYPDILASDADMLGLKQLVERYVNEYN